MRFLGNLGIDIQLLIAQLINFGVLLWLLAKFVYKPTINRIEKDEHELEKARATTQHLEEEKKKFHQQNKQEVVEAKKQAREIIAEAENIAEETRKRAREEAAKEKQAVIKQIRDRLKNIDAK